MNVGRVYVPICGWVDHEGDDMAYHHVYTAVGIVIHRVTFWGREFYGEIEHEG